MILLHLNWHLCTVVYFNFYTQHWTDIGPSCTIRHVHEVLHSAFGNFTEWVIGVLHSVTQLPVLTWIKTHDGPGNQTSRATYYCRKAPKPCRQVCRWHRSSAFIPNLLLPHFPDVYYRMFLFSWSCRFSVSTMEYADSAMAIHHVHLHHVQQLPESSHPSYITILSCNTWEATSHPCSTLSSA